MGWQAWKASWRGEVAGLSVDGGTKNERSEEVLDPAAVTAMCPASAIKNFWRTVGNAA
jgi:hypothetical protein